MTSFSGRATENPYFISQDLLSRYIPLFISSSDTPENPNTKSMDGS